MLATILRERDWFVVRAIERGWDRVPDEQLLELATREQLAVYTANRGDFARLGAAWAATSRVHAGIIIRSSQWASSIQQAASLEALVALYGSDFKNQVLLTSVAR